MAPATPLLFLDDAKASNCQKNNGFKDLDNYSEWPKVAGAMIKALGYDALRFSPLAAAHTRGRGSLPWVAETTSGRLAWQERAGVQRLARVP